MKKLLFFVTALVAANLTQAQWEPDVRLTNDPAVSWVPVSNSLPIVTNGDTVHVVWQEFRDGDAEIYYKRSVDGGVSWNADTRLTYDGYSYDAGMALSGSDIHVVWSDDRDGSTNVEIYYKRSEDGGSIWGADTRLTFADSWSDSPSIAIEDSIIHLVWYDWRDATGDWDYEIYYKRSTDGGLTWGPDTRLTDNPSYSGFPCVAVSGQVVHVVWEDDRDVTMTGSIYYKRSADGGATWGPDTRLSELPSDGWDPVVAVSGSNVHVVWMDERGGEAREIYYNRSTDGGLTWSEDTRLTNAVASSEYPTIAVSGDMVHVVWGDNRDMNYEVYYKLSEDAGMTWEEDVRLTDAFGESNYPFVATSDSTVHVIWNESRDGNEEIYYKRNPTGNIIVGTEETLASNSSQSFTIYPNPASSRIHVQFKDYQITQSLFTIRNIFGKTLINQSIRRGEEEIDVSMLPNGIYFATSKIGIKPVYTTKLIIAKD